MQSRKYLILLSCLFFINLCMAKPIMNNTKFKNPVASFIGVWRVVSYDLREFELPPENIETQMIQDNIYSGLPIGQIVQFARGEDQIMPGTIDPNAMKSTGPIGPVLEISLLPPFVEKLCGRPFWRAACEMPKSPFSSAAMLTEITDWTKSSSKENILIWKDVKKEQYHFNHLGKQYYFDARVARNGDILLDIILDGKVKGGGAAGLAGIRLRRVGK